MSFWPFSQLDRIEADTTRLVSRLDSLFDRINKLETNMAADLSTIIAAVTAEKTVEDSAIKLLQGLSAQIAALASQPTVDPAALQAIADSINVNATTLAAAVTANTPKAGKKP